MYPVRASGKPQLALAYQITSRSLSHHHTHTHTYIHHTSHTYVHAHTHIHTHKHKTIIIFRALKMEINVRFHGKGALQHKN